MDRTKTILFSLLVILVALTGCAPEAGPSPETAPASPPAPASSAAPSAPEATPVPAVPQPPPAPDSSGQTTPAPPVIPDEIIASPIGFLGAGHDAPALVELGARWDRPHPGPFVWGRVEKEKGNYDWREIDAYVQDIQRFNFGTVATIWFFADWDQAAWGQPGAGGIIFEREIGAGRRKPHDMEAYRRFVSALVERYDGDGTDDMPGLKYPIKHWEAGNEPSMQEDFHTFFTGSPEDYLEVLETTYRAVKEADPEARVLHAGMAGMEPWMVSFWEPVFAGGSRFFDIANIHSIGASDELNVPAFRDLLSEHDIDKPIWVTEAQHLSGKTRDGREVSLEEHGDITLKSYVISFAHGAEKIFYTSFRAPSFAPPEFQQAALVGGDGEKRPAYHALETLVQKLGAFTAAEELAPGRYRFLVDGEEIYVLWGDGSLDLEKRGPSG